MANKCSDRRVSLRASQLHLPWCMHSSVKDKINDNTDVNTNDNYVKKILIDITVNIFS